MSKVPQGNAGHVGVTDRAPEVDLLIAVLTQALDDASGGVDKGRSGWGQDQGQAELFMFEREGNWADSRKLFLATLDIEEGYFLRLARKYVEGRHNGTVAAIRAQRGGRPCAADREQRKFVPLDLPPLEPEPPEVAETYSDVAPAGQSVAERVLAAFRAAAPLAVNVKHLSETLSLNERSVRSAITRLNIRGHRIKSLGNSIFLLEL